MLRKAPRWPARADLGRPRRLGPGQAADSNPFAARFAIARLRSCHERGGTKEKPTLVKGGWAWGRAEDEDHARDAVEWALFAWRRRRVRVVNVNIDSLAGNYVYALLIECVAAGIAQLDVVVAGLDAEVL